MNIKLIISDLDGVILDFKEIHFEALNMALESFDKKFVISYEDHVKTFDGLSTKKKLSLLSNMRGFPIDKVDYVNDLKQKFTTELISKFDNINYEIKNVVKKLKDDGYSFYVASNAVLNTIELGLKKLGIYDLVDGIYSNENVSSPKPNPEIYLRCMVDASVSPHETLIIEDSRYGREAATLSGANVCGIDNSFGFTYDMIKSFIDNITTNSVKWAGKANMNVLIPMSGLGSRFAKVGFKLPKPLIDIDGKPMIQCVVENLNIDANFIFVVQDSHYDEYNLGVLLPLIAPNCKIVKTAGLTEGAACSTLVAKEFINNDQHLLIANSDQILEWDSCSFMWNMISTNADGGLLTFNDTDPKWSFSKIDSNGYVTEVAEKKPISDLASTGIYYYKHGKDYVKYAEQMIFKNIRTNNEFYICPVYNEFIADGKKIRTFNCDKMHGVGTPEDRELYLKFLDEKR